MTARIAAPFFVTDAKDTENKSIAEKS